VITVVDYGMGNLRNIRQAFREIGHETLITQEKESIAAAGKLVLPGVGAFGEALRRIDALGVRDLLVAHAASGRPLLGICLGMQLLFEESEESPGALGLGILPGCVRKFSGEVKIPHVGWNDVRSERASVYFPNPEDRPSFYFVHSYRVDPVRETIGLTDYGGPFSAAVQRGNITGFQFHPEKSQDAGLGLLRIFAAS
jgi:imidazole glycerol phosphate synthase glutamine amidotransferase subunit